ncbi:UNVERIFIED_CONTAM: protein REPRESSOR OF SILENCING 3 [Sesamum calycinum]|uniref:Protein REPRESSOR OF SILENCING 3 n=1 Tax=Sesamum calycinum TaxID=2727403 RepID=A0AAW2K1A2_9LAMI
MWKGGKLKLEKAKEHYLLRLRREWAEDAELETKLPSNVDADESVDTSQKPLKDQDIEKMQLNIFFPKLRKIKPIPLRGSGKHKYSFQRVEVPPLPIHFCDCEEHSGPPESAERNCTDHETETYGVNEDELNMMKSILDKLLEKENYSKTIPNEDEFIGEVNHNVTSADEFQVDDNDEDQVSDEDNLVINIVGQPRKRVALSGDREQKVSAANQDSLARASESLSSSIHKKHGSEKGKLLSDKKRKQSVHGSCSTDSVPSKRKATQGLHMTARVELQQFNGIDSSSSRNAKQKRSVSKDQNSPIEDISKPQGRASKDIHVTPRNVDALAKEQKHAGPDGGPANSDSKQIVEENNEASAPENDTHLIQIIELWEILL